MADTSRLDRLTEVVDRAGAKLVAIGDGAQLPSIGAGGMFDRLTEIAPSAALSNVRRTLDPAEQRAWADLRAGRSDRAMAHYLRRGRLHMTDTRDQAVEHAVQDWATLTETIPIGEVALISDASNLEINRLNARAQHYRAERGELGDIEVEIPGVHYGIRAGDQVAMIDQHHQPGVERVENGARGEVIDITETGEVLIQFDATNQWRTLAGDDLARLRLGYASHIHRAQGATVTRTLVVTGGWQTSKEPAYVEASRAREGTDWYVNRQDLGERRSRHRPHQTPRTRHEPQPHTNTITRTPRAPRLRTLARLRAHNRKPRPRALRATSPRHHPHPPPRRPAATTGEDTMSGSWPAHATRDAWQPKPTRQTRLTADDVMTARDVARLLHVPVSTVEDWARREILPSVKIGRRRLYIRQNIETTY